MNRTAIVLAVLCILGALASPAAVGSLGLEGKQQGVSWVGGRHPVTAADLQPLRDNGVKWIVQTPFGWQRGHLSTKVQLNTDAHLWGESDEGLRVTARLAREMGIRTLLKPHIWVIDRQHGKWRSDIAMQSEEEWDAWFESYSTFILHYARLAEEEKMAGLCVGTELHGTVKREKQWRGLIAQIRQVYRGQITYAANWWSEFEEVGFWDELDFIGVQAYFPLAGGQRPPVDQLKNGWQPHLATLEAVSKRHNKRILFTEIGYRSDPAAAIEPWKWPQHIEDRQVCLETQANAYQAFFEAVWPRDWLAGAYFWKWFPQVRDPQGNNGGFTPQGKPAEAIIRRYYTGADQP